MYICSFIFVTISESLSTECIFPVCRGSTASGVDSIKVDRTFVMFPSFRMLSQSFYQWANHRDSERGKGRRDEEYTAGKRNVFATVCGWVMDQELITQACPLHFGPNTLCRICFVFFFQVHINNLLSFVCDFPSGGGETLKTLNTFH